MFTLAMAGLAGTFLFLRAELSSLRARRARVRASASAPSRVDSLGLPLPPGAVGRLGDPRFQHEAEIESVLLTSTETVIAVGRHDTLHAWDLRTGRRLARIKGGWQFMEAGSLRLVSPDGRFLVSGPLRGSTEVLVHDISSGERVGSFPFSRPGGLVTFLRDDELLVVERSGEQAIRRHLPSGREMSRLALLAPAGHPAPNERTHPVGLRLRTLVASPDGSRALLLTQTFEPFLLDLEAGNLRRLPRPGEWEAHTLAFSQDSRLLVAGNDLGELLVWDAETSAPPRRLAAPPPVPAISAGQERVSRIRNLQVEAGGETVLVVRVESRGKPPGERESAPSLPGSHGLEVERRSLASGEIRASWSLPLSEPGPTDLAPDASLVAVAQGQQVHFLPLGGDFVPRKRGEQGGRIRRLRWSPDGRRLAVVSGDRITRVWDAVSGVCAARLASDSEPLFADLAYVSANRVLTSRREDGERVLLGWDPASGERVPLHPLGSAEFILSGDGRWLIERIEGDHRSSSREAPKVHLRILHAPSGHLDAPSGHLDGPCYQEVQRLERRMYWYDRLALSPGGEFLAHQRGEGGDIFLLEIESGRERCLKPRHRSMVRDLAFSPDGSRLAATTGRAVQVWTTDGGAPSLWISRRAGRTGAPRLDRGLSGDGREERAGMTLFVLDRATGWDLVEGPGDTVAAVAWSPDGRLLAYGESDGSVVVCGTERGFERARFAGHGGEVWSLAFSPDGRTLASGSRDGTVLLWSLDGLDRMAPE